MSFSRGARALRPLSRGAVFRPKRNFVTAAPSSLVPVVDFGKVYTFSPLSKLMVMFYISAVFEWK
ncbi:hypothetical protein BT69DRAFT_332267 [Atractiella rhizophila]|nr:hypothetical protein BT69DRAFT_332267 [Atractiella rhizophila]